MSSYWQGLYCLDSHSVATLLCKHLRTVKDLTVSLRPRKTSNGPHYLWPDQWLCIGGWYTTSKLDWSNADVDVQLSTCRPLSLHLTTFGYEQGEEKCLRTSLSQLSIYTLEYWAGNLSPWLYYSLGTWAWVIESSTILLTHSNMVLAHPVPSSASSPCWVWESISYLLYTAGGAGHRLVRRNFGK
jgi:hypothetical protein